MATHEQAHAAASTSCRLVMGTMPLTRNWKSSFWTVRNMERLRYKRMRSLASFLR